MNGETVRRPGGSVRLLLLGAIGAAFFEVFSVGFPPAAPDRLPILLVALALALVSAWNPGRGLLVFSFLFPLAGLGDRLFGGADAIAWPVLLFAGFAGGWTFRFLYDFESSPDPSRVDGTLKALTAVWSLAALLGVVRARTLWALFRGLSLRAVNGEGLLDAAAVRDSVLSLAVLAAGVGYFFILRRSGEASRERALVAALAGVGASAAVAVAERLGLPPGETSDFWRMTGRMSGGAIDPNALGMLCGLSLAMVVPALLLGGLRRSFSLSLLALLSAGLVFSGSRSGLAVAGLGALALFLAPGLPARGRLALAALAAAAALAAGVLLLRGAHGSLGERVGEVFDGRLPIVYRSSARPLLWESAVRLFQRHPIAGAGLGSFSWQLPDLLRELGQSLPMRDNPGNAYLQALAETGVIGFLLTLVFAVVLAREGFAALADPSGRPFRAGSGAAILGFLVALLTGSHWFAPDIALLFFLAAAVVARPGVEAAVLWPRRARRLLVGAYAVAACATAARTLSPEETFRHRQGVGFHGKEIGPNGPFYWTQRRFAVEVQPGETLRLTLARFTPDGRSAQLLAESDGRILLDRTFAPGQVIALRLEGATARAHVIRFSLSRAFTPKRLGLSGDRRELGVMAVFPSGT